MSSIQILLQDMYRLENDLSRFELKFGVKSQDFYKAMMAGELEEFDDLDDYRMEFMEWLALYETWLSFREKYRHVIERQPVAIQIKTHLEPVYA